MEITRIFKSKVRKEIFRIFFANPDKAYYLRELERILGVPVSMIQRELRNLERGGLFRRHKQGNLLYYSIDKNYPLFDEYRSIISKTIGVRRQMSDVLETIGGIKVAFIYGSFARNEKKADSDIDLFLIGSIDERRLVTEINRLEKLLTREINYILYKPDEFQRKRQQRDGFILDIMESPKIFLIGNDDEF